MPSPDRTPPPISNRPSNPADPIRAQSSKLPAPKLPKIPTTELRLKDTHRLIASRFSETGTVLSRLTPNPSTLASLLELDDATNDRFLGEEGLLPGIGIHELVYGIRYAHIVNAAFTHASPTGGRFNSATRGAWYASLDRLTSLAEIAFHKLRALEEIDWPHEEISTSDDYLADITSPFHDLRTSDLRTPDLRNPDPRTPDPRTPNSRNPDPRSSDSRNPDAFPPALSRSVPDPESQTISPAALPSPDSAERSGMAIKAVATPSITAAQEALFARYLRPDPIPRCYARPQHLADRLLTHKSNGIIYPSVRRPGGTCLVAFRPALVYNVRRGARLELRLQPNRPFRPSQAREIPIPQP